MSTQAPILALTFLAPVAGIVAASISVPLLALLYFLKLRRRPMRVSSTLLWDASAADFQVNIPFRWIRLSWLLLLQTLLLALLSMAIARPAIEGNESPIGRIAIVIDHSASMSAIDVRPANSSQAVSRLEAAKDRAKQFIDRMDSGAQAMIVSLAARPRALTSLTRDRGQLRRAVDSIAPTDQRGDRPAALELVGAALRSTDEETAPGRVVLLSDGGEDTAGRVAPSGLGRAQLNFVRVGPEPYADRDNLGIVALAAKREYEDPAMVRLFVRIQSVLPGPVEASLSVLIDGQIELAERVTVPGLGEDGAPGELARSLALDRPAGGLVVARLARPDALESDNTAALVLDPPAAARILLVQPAGGSAVIDGLALDVLESVAPAALRRMTKAVFEQAAAQGGLEAAFDLIVFDRVRPETTPTLPTLSIGAGVAIPGLVVAPLDENDARLGRTEIAFWKRTHPVMRAVSLANVIIDRPMRLELPGSPGSLNSATALELASGAGGPLIALIEHRGVRRLVIGFALADSRWWQHPSFPIFIKNSVDFLSGRGSDQAGRSWRTIENLSVRVDPAAEELAIDGPITFTRPVDQAALAGEGGRQSLGTLPRVGVYRIRGARPLDEVVAVNLLDPGESAIRTLDEIPVGSESIAGASLGATAPREIWQWLVLAALGLLAIEWCVFAWRMRI